MVFLKPTSSLRLIHPRSLHPNHTKTGVIFSQMLRFFKNCTFKADFLFHLNFLTRALTNQGYTRSTLRKIKQKVFSQVNYQVGENGELLKGFFPCKTNCKVCVEHGLARSTISFPGGAKVIAQYLSCTSKNAIYIIVCQRCSQLYIGETGNPAKIRITQHLSNIRLKRNTPVSDHFNSKDHSISDLKFFVLLSNPSWETNKRKLLESKWIRKLNTLKPKGINIELNRVTNKYITVPFKGRNSVPASLSVFLNHSVKTCFTSGLPLRVNFNHKHSIARQSLPQMLH